MLRVLDHSSGLTRNCSLTNLWCDFLGKGLGFMCLFFTNWMQHTLNARRRQSVVYICFCRYIVCASFSMCSSNCADEHSFPRQAVPAVFSYWRWAKTESETHDVNNRIKYIVSCLSNSEIIATKLNSFRTEAIFSGENNLLSGFCHFWWW